jgi:outer membrane protein OmpA-like peptidoglycan-associated protein
MKLTILKAALVAAILSSPWTACSQHYYVVIGAFAAEENASEFKGYLPGQFRDTSYTLSDKENILHFYVLKTSDKESAIAKTLQLKKEIEDSETSDNGTVETRLQGSVFNNVVTETAVPVSNTDSPAAEESPADASGSGSLASAGNIPPKPVGKYFKFNIETPEGTSLPAVVHHVDFDNGREVAAYKSNMFVDLLQPGQNAKPMAVVCGLFGYKEIHKYIDYSDPSLTDEQAYVDTQGAWVIPYKLERVEKGDVSVMYNVSFYKDAAIMRKSSQVDLDELVNMMQSNPYYEITVHAHCNGKNKREIIALGKDRNYFDVSGSTTITGTARDLTALRAEAIRAYLMDHGIDGSRTKIFSWGGSDMLVKSTSPNATLNDRIEIEFTRD